MTSDHAARVRRVILLLRARRVTLVPERGVPRSDAPTIVKPARELPERTP